ncbi:MAG: type VI secretion system tip protein TssI/VgrG [Gammaproteobacteria bacterium]|nr:type VI secretion system tip protein TssI/VgrG [Gammaproteobacteria bacterium]
MQQGVSTRVSIATSRRIRFALTAMHASDALSTPYRYVLDVSGSAGLDLDRLLGMGVSVRVDQPGRLGRFFHGLVDRASAGAVHGKSGDYRVELVPALAELARCNSQRLFAEMSPVDVVADILAQHGIAFEAQYRREHVAHELVVQYNESDLDFVSRLLAEQGVFYRFAHAVDGHTLQLFDDPADLAAWPGYPGQTLLADGDSGEGIVRLDAAVSARATRVELDDVDPLSPTLDLASAAGTVRRGESCATVTEYPGGYRAAAHGASLARTRLHAARVGYLTFAGSARSRGVVVGRPFAVHGYPGIDDGAHLVPTESTIELVAGPPTAAGPKVVVATLHTAFAATPVEQPLPLPLAPRRPLLHGPHTAAVVGPDGETTHVDEHARVQVRFPWQQADSPSPWVRVSQAWAGSGRGALSIPRIGDEVLVAFEHGDARRPIVVGSLYNGANVPPVALPDNQAQTLWQTRALPSGPANALRLDDTADSELMALEAGRDYRLSVDNDAFVEIGGQLSETFRGGRMTTVDGNLIGTVDGTTTISLGNDISVDADRRCDLASRKSMTVTSDDRLTVSAGKRLVIGGQHAIRIHNQNAYIELQADGDIFISGKRVTVKASDKLTLKGKNVVEQEGG